ncbi:MAG: helix-turn-helix domain-containing protein [Bacteroidia bacterium]|nr:helix-turn-helix domain-containing protein [Bacteroidia bacterium]
MHFLSKNLKLLRKRKGITQEDTAQKITTTRVSINSYENGIAEPAIETLISISDFYQINLDTLIKVDLTSLSETQLTDLETGSDTFIKGSKLRVLATTVNSTNKDNVELIPIKARAGYTAGYNDPEYIVGLPTLQLPFLSRERKYRAFQIQGDSMLPIPDKSYIVGEYIDNWYEIKDGSAYVILTQDDGPVFKVAYNHIKKNKTLLLKSLNPLYQPYEINIKDVKEIWKFVNYISEELPVEGMSMQDLVATVLYLKNEVKSLKKNSKDN